MTTDRLDIGLLQISVENGERKCLSTRFLGLVSFTLYPAYFSGHDILSDRTQRRATDLVPERRNENINKLVKAHSFARLFLNSRPKSATLLNSKKTIKHVFNELFLRV